MSFYNQLRQMRSSRTTTSKNLYGWKAHHAMFLGVTGSGKTHQALAWLSDQSGLKIYIDTKNELADNPKYAKCFNMIVKKFSAYELILEQLREYSKQNMMVALVPPFKKATRNKQVNDFLIKVWEMKIVSPNRLVVLVDEVHAYSNKVLDTISDLTLQGRSKELIMGIISQGWSDIPKNVRRNCLLVVILKQDKAEITELMDQGIIPYDRDNRGWRVPKMKFSRKHEAWAYMKDASEQLVRLYP